jgi:hypothetical protein
MTTWKHIPSDDPDDEAPGLLETWELEAGGFVAVILHCPANSVKSFGWRILPAETRALEDATGGGTEPTLIQAMFEAETALRDTQSLPD